MPEKTPAEKAHVKPGATVAVINPVPGVIESLGLPSDVTFTDPRNAQLVFLFVTGRAELEAQMPVVAAQLTREAALWVFFRKGSKAAGLDMNRDDVWRLAEGLGMRPLGLIGIDGTWSAFRLRLAQSGPGSPKAGQQ